MEAFWELLLDSTDAVTEIPRERFDASRWYSPVAGKPQRIRNLSGGFLDDIDQFDASFFGITPSEAELMDPQQRLMLEVAWEALEDAGQIAEQLAGSNSGVYASTIPSGYWDMLRDAGQYGLHAMMGGETGGMIAGLISYQLDLRGPTMAVDATCATSLLSVHLATRALRSGEIDLAIVGGSNLMLSPDKYFALSEAEMLSPRGQCHFGDASADGFVRSEGVVVVILKRLSDCVRDGDRPYAAIRGTAARSDGRTGGTITTPGRAGQEALLRAAYQDAGVSPADVHYVEAHGPGTPSGDPVELQALSSVLREGRPPGSPCLVGSAKSNIGHTEIAAGLVGLLKTALILRHRTVPATLHVTSPLPLFDQTDAPLRLATQRQRLVGNGKPTIAGVSAFGLSGATTHVVLTEVPLPIDPPAPQPQAAYLLPLSARHTAALTATAARCADLLAAPDAPALTDACFTAGTRRTQHDRRVAVVGINRREVVDGLSSIASGTPDASVIGDGTKVSGRPRVVFVFPGQGSQWPGMGSELLRTNTTFASRLEECDWAVRAELGWSPIELLTNWRVLSTVEKVQPTLWAIQVALAAVWQDWGIEPDLVIGHSMGEIAAAVTTGALTLAEGASVICRRSSLLASQDTPGAMWAIQLGEHAALHAIGGNADRVCVGVVNSRHSTVLSGDPVALAQIVEPLRQRGVFCSQVQVDYASHAPHVEPLRPHLVKSLAQLQPRRGQVPIHSTVLDQVVDGAELDAGYWANNLRLPVRFASVIQSVLAEGRSTLFIEISPHPVLRSAIEDGIEASTTEATIVGSLRRNQGELAALLTSLATTYSVGCEPDWGRVNNGGRFVTLQSYSWQRERFWVRAANNNDVPVMARPSLPSRDQGDWSTAPAPGPELADPHQAERAAARESAAGCAQYLLRRIAMVLGLCAEDIDPSIPMTLHGVSSLFATKLAYQLRSELRLQISVRELLEARSITDLAANLNTRLRAGPADGQPSKESGETTFVA